MAFTLDPTEPLGDEVRRVARSELSELSSALEHPDESGVRESIHDARKHAKKLRALARLVRPGLGDLYRPTNVALRDAARCLAEARDAHVMIETLDGLVESAPGHLGHPEVTAARAELVTREQRIHRALGARSDEFVAARLLAAQAADLIDSWQIHDDFGVIAGGLAKTYRRFVDAAQRCRIERSVEGFHEWRKRAKYHRHHLELLRGTYRPLVEPWADEMHRLTDLLGEDHDIAVLAARVRAHPEFFGGSDEADAIIVLAEGRSSMLREAALSLASRLASEDCDAVVARLATWWSAARDDGS